MRYRRILVDLQRGNDTLPRTLIHIGYNPAHHNEGMIRHIVGDNHNRINISPLVELPDFRSKKVVNALEKSLKHQWNELHKAIYDQATEHDRVKRQITIALVNDQLQEWQPYGLTFWEYSTYMLFKELVESQVGPQKD